VLYCVLLLPQVGGAFELLRPNVKDILYTLEVNTFKVRLLGTYLRI
jgi:hypothetical protein